jgi:hypothetical protein
MDKLILKSMNNHILLTFVLKPKAARGSCTSSTTATHIEGDAGTV